MQRQVRITRVRPARGLTLPELLVVLAIIGITLAIAVPNLTRSREHQALKAGARELSTALREARRLAIAERANYALVLDCSAMSSNRAAAVPVTRYWIAIVDGTFDPASDNTDIADADAAAPFDGDFSTLDLVGDVRELPNNIVVVGATIQSTNFQGDDFATFRINVMRTEDFDLSGALTGDRTEDVGVNGVDDGSGAAFPPQQGFEGVDAGEDDTDIDPVYRIIRFGPQGNADRATIWLWNVSDGRAPLPGTVANAPASLVGLGLPPGLSIQAINDQRNYFTVSDQTQDGHYHTIDVNPVTGSVQVYDYARGTGTVGPPNDWDQDKYGEA